jgi:hypothetical protein
VDSNPNHFTRTTRCHSKEDHDMNILLLSSAPQPSLGLGLLHKIRLNFLEASQQFSFYMVGLLAPRPTPIQEDQASVFISPRGRVATHFSPLLRHACVTVGLFLFPGHHTGRYEYSKPWKSQISHFKYSYRIHLNIYPPNTYVKQVVALMRFCKQNFVRIIVSLMHAVLPSLHYYQL